ncbi:tyrosine-type recombinase/integrase [Pseudodesulfovibrio sp. zrk46]|uniref:tyrosine-type recombinase/integrase n=1 Tax=Pseudodesulfovibrio sp. zrk46 TaxID=2725288 RepID=UPI0014496814|nr:tyrosine-type recombinase/integrase [Pseudodesulfovibrio sp. zrk46]QJB57464.1 tyrosine-type recombinase/integrase [Pseudodesulfovibrio sp. zrk46]
MKGCRPLTEVEVRRVLVSFSGRYEVRNRCLFVLGVLCGFRVSEMLSLRIRDVVAGGLVCKRVKVPKRNMKGSKEGRTAFLPPEGQRAVLGQIQALEYPAPDDFLFRSQRGKNRAISPSQAHRVLVSCFESCGVVDQVSTHSMRKTFADRMYTHFLQRVADGEKVDAFTETSLALGHRDPASTRHYLSFRDDERCEAAKAIGKALYG